MGTVTSLSYGPTLLSIHGYIGPWVFLVWLHRFLRIFGIITSPFWVFPVLLDRFLGIPGIIQLFWVVYIFIFLVWLHWFLGTPGTYIGFWIFPL